MELEQIYILYFKDVYNYIYGISKNSNTAEEITQETFFKALKNANKYDGTKDIRAWLFTIAKNTYYTQYKREKNYNKKKEIPLNEISILDKLIDDEQTMMIHKFLHELNDPYKEVFMLRFFGELSYDKIATIFGKTSAWARVTFYRAKKEILEKMEAQNNEK